MRDRSSAEPDKLLRYASNGLRIDGENMAQSAHLRGRLHNFQATCSEYSVSTLHIADAMTSDARAMETHDQWVQRVALGFRAADVVAGLPGLGGLLPVLDRVRVSLPLPQFVWPGITWPPRIVMRPPVVTIPPWLRWPRWWWQWPWSPTQPAPGAIPWAQPRPGPNPPWVWTLPGPILPILPIMPAAPRPPVWATLPPWLPRPSWVTTPSWPIDLLNFNLLPPGIPIPLWLHGILNGIIDGLVHWRKTEEDLRKLAEELKRREEERQRRIAEEIAKRNGPRVGQGIHPKVPLKDNDFQVHGIPGVHDKRLYDAVINQFDVQFNDRYKQRGDDTYCNIFVSEVTRAMGVGIPAILDKDGNPWKPGAQPPYDYLDANEMVGWLDKQDKQKVATGQEGWHAVSAKQAQQWAMQGYCAVAAWPNPVGKGHIAVVRPSDDAPTDDPIIAQAGADCWNKNKVSETFKDPNGRDLLAAGEVKFYVYGPAQAS